MGKMAEPVLTSPAIPQKMSSLPQEKRRVHQQWRHGAEHDCGHESTLAVTPVSQCSTACGSLPFFVNPGRFPRIASRSQQGAGSFWLRFFYPSLAPGQSSGLSSSLSIRSILKFVHCGFIACSTGRRYANNWLDSEPSLLMLPSLSVPGQQERAQL